MFTTNHFIWLAICVVLIGALTFFSLKFKFSLKTATWIIVGISVASELCKIFTHMTDATSGGMVLEPTALPFHLCSILIFLFFYILLCKNEQRRKKVLEFIVPIALLGGLLAILLPTSGVNFARPYAYQCFIYHACVIWFAIYLIASKKVNLGHKTYLRNCLVMLALVVVMLWVNSILSVYDVNFFYLVRPPMDNLPLLNLDNGWGAYFVTLLACGLILVTIVHAPSMICEFVRYRKNKTTKATENVDEIPTTDESKNFDESDNLKK